jgi:hypothetical protein
MTLLEIMTNQQKIVLGSIKTQLELAKEKDDGAKTAEMHMQFLINASVLESLKTTDIISYLGLNDSYKAELSKMLKLYQHLKINGISLVKHF